MSVEKKIKTNIQNLTLNSSKLHDPYINEWVAEGVASDPHDFTCKVATKVIEIIHRLFLVIAMYCQAS